MSPWVWWLLYLVVMWSTPSKKLCRGWFTRYVLAKIIPPKRWWQSTHRDLYRYFLWLCICGPLIWVHKISDHMFDLLFWGGYILVILDDYLNGDDDPKKKWQEVKNKVKWKMKLPASQPVRDGTA